MPTAHTYNALPLYDIQSVEAVKGPTASRIQQFLGNVTGTINYVTKRPTAVPGGEVNFTVGNFGTYRTVSLMAFYKTRFSRIWSCPWADLSNLWS